MACSTGRAYNPYEECTAYCLQDVCVLATSIWEPWRDAVREATACASLPHCTLAAPPVHVLSLDPGQQLGVCLLHYDGIRHELLLRDDRGGRRSGGGGAGAAGGAGGDGERAHGDHRGAAARLGCSASSRSGRRWRRSSADWAP